MTIRIHQLRLTLFTLSALVLAHAGPSKAASLDLLAQATTPSTKPAAQTAATPPARNWLVSCSDDAPDGGSRCRMVQTLMVQKTGQRLLTIVIQKAQTSKEPKLIVGLPHGVYFPAGIGLAVDDGKAQQIAVETSDADGAYATTDIAAEMLKGLLAGTALKINFQSSAKQPITVPVTLDGFGDAYRRVDAFGG